VLEAQPNPQLVVFWKRLACGLSTLAPHAAKCVGKQTLQFYVADGRYRMQVFALEDLQDGNFTVYCPDIVEEAVKLGLATRGSDDQDPTAAIVPSYHPLSIRLLNGASLNLGGHYKDMVGWNRKAIQIMLTPPISSAQIEATELLCALAAQHFARPKPSGA